MTNMFAKLDDDSIANLKFHVENYQSHKLCESFEDINEIGKYKPVKLFENFKVTKE